MTYAIISLGGKQYRVQAGQRLLVDHLPHGPATTFHPRVLFLGGDGRAEFSPKGAQVTATVVGDVLGEKIRIGKYKRRTGYRRHAGHRSKLTEIEITAIGAAGARPKPQAERSQAREAEAKSAPRTRQKAGASAPAEGEGKAASRSRAQTAKAKEEAD